MVKILHLYPKLMNLYGDYANITVLKKHLEDQGLQVYVQTKEIDEKINFDKYDFIYMGSGSESNLKVALNNILKYKADFIDCVNKGKNILFTGNAMELLGKYIDNDEALSVFDFETKHTNKHYAGDVILKSNDLGFVVGYINKTTQIKGAETNKLFDYIYMGDGLSDNEYEGCHINNVYGTHVIGPVLVKNPDFLLKIVKDLMPKGKKIKSIKYNDEVNSYIEALNLLKEKIDDR